LHAVKKIWSYDYHATRVAEYLLKFYEIFDATAETLPHLKHVDLNLQLQGKDTFWIRVTSSYKDGILSANLREAETKSPPSDYVNDDW
jgi:hypothetical protein